MSDSVSEPVFRLDVSGAPHPLIVTAFSGREGISQLFCFDLQVLEQDGVANLAGLMYRNCYLSLDRQGGGVHGQIQGINLGPQAPLPGHFQLRLGPRLGCLGQRFNRRIFQGQSVPAVLRQVLGEHGIRREACAFVLKGDYPARACCVQFDESDLQFIQRLCAEEGLHFHFQHSRRGHQLVFADSSAAFRRARRVAFATQAQAAVQDFCVSIAGGGRRRAGRAREQAAGASDLAQLSSGALVPLTGHPLARWNRLWLITEVRHRGGVPGSAGECSGQGTAGAYRNDFKALSWELAFRSATRIAKPVLGGIFRGWVTALGVPAHISGQQARVAVQLEAFYQGRGAQWPPCWLPLASQPGNTLAVVGGLQVGEQVWVRFLGNDPDQPCIAGRVEPLAFQ